jgi:hypothetical protein
MLRQIMSDQFGVDFLKNPTIDAVISLANQNRFDPVLDMLAGEGRSRVGRQPAQKGSAVVSGDRARNVPTLADLGISPSYPDWLPPCWGSATRW